MKRRVISIILCGLMVTGLLAGCGDSASSTTASTTGSSGTDKTAVVADSATSETTSAQSTTAEARTSDVSGSLTIWEHDTAFESSLEAVVEGFKAKYPNVDVEYEFKSDDYQNALTIAIQSGDAPDVFWTNGTATAYFGEFQKADALMDLTDIVDTSELPEDGLSIGTIDGKLYSVPWSCVDTRACYYNKDLFEDNGWEVPKTFDEFEELLQKEKDAGYIPISLSPNNAWSLLFAFEPILSAYDSDYTEGLADYSVKATDEPARGAMNKMLEWAEKGYFGDNYLGVADGNAQVLTFTSGEAVMDIDGSWDTNTFLENNPDLNLGAFQIPDNNGKTGMVGTLANGFSIYKGTKNVEAATAFLQYCATTEAQQAWVDGQGAVSGNKNVKSGSAVAEEIANCDTMYTSWQAVLTKHAKDGENASTLFENDITKVFTGDMTTDEFFDEIANVMQ